ncbi:FRG domain-containing protein [Devosia sp. FKR38]|uniref:FRG domain-containing protein n=1 Tax=Devosia sp. FKR38 TaxID=2562312 RepID=UPI0010C0EA68|nr:FRG domain-containing protein [Devosia sp. FKR38]
MRSITPQLTVDLKTHVGSETVAKAPPFQISSFRNLVEHIAHLSYLNPDHLLFYRGQNTDFLNKAASTTIYPGIYRSENSSKDELRHRFALLEQAGKELVKRWAASKLEGLRDIRQKTYVQWSILQHYGVLETPLLDITHSLRVACSFAQHDSASDHSIVYVLGMPQVTNRISVNSEDDLVNVRLLSICPPSALRPHFQEGFLAGTTDVTWDFDSKTDLDFRNRLIAKFSIPAGTGFWGRGFNSIPKQSLYPAKDKVRELCIGLRESLKSELQPGDLGEFMKAWTDLEAYIFEQARDISIRSISGRSLQLREAIEILVGKGHVSPDIASQLQALRHYRNLIVHSPSRVDPQSTTMAISTARQILGQLRSGRATM